MIKDKENVDIGIVIRTYNEEQMLPLVLDAIMKQTIQSFKIVIVDSESTDSTLSIARSYENIKIINIKQKDFTYGRALNIGIASIVNDVKYIVIVSGHSIPCNSHWLEQLILPLKNNLKVVAVYGKQQPYEKHLSNTVVKVLAATAYKMYGDDEIITNKDFTFSNANSAIRISSWVDRPFDEDVVFGEDQCWVRETIMDDRNYIVYQPKASVYHSHPDTFYQYYRRCYKEEKSLSRIDSSRTPFTFFQLVRQFVLFFKEFLLKVFSSKNSLGSYWGIFCVRVVWLFAAYMGRRQKDK